MEKIRKYFKNIFYYVKSKIKINEVQFLTEKHRVFMFTLWISLISISKPN